MQRLNQQPSSNFRGGSGYHSQSQAGSQQTTSQGPAVGTVQPQHQYTNATAPISQHTAATTYTTALKSSESNSTNTSKRSTQKTLAHALLPDLPLLMHGSGDVLPENVHPHSVATLAQLIEKYVASLVGAAMDAHDVFTDGEVVGGGACLGPPPFRATGGQGDDDDDIDEAKKRKASSQKLRRKRQKKIDYWDEPLPPPPVEDNDGADSSNDSLMDSEFSDDDSDDDAPLISASSTNAAENPFSLQGLAPVDLHANERTRKYYVSAPTVMDARSFIFPICHDAVLYQRIKEVQASRRAIGRDVVDGALMEIMKEEGMNEGRRGMVDMLDAVLGSVVNNGESNEDIRGGQSSSLADKKKGAGSSSKAYGKNEMKGADKKKEIEINAGAKSDGSNLVGAGLLDANIDPSWPGLNALSRGRLW